MRKFDFSKTPEQIKQEQAEIKRWEEEFNARLQTIGSNPETVEPTELPKKPNEQILINFINSLSEKQQEEFSEISGYLRSVNEKLDSDASKSKVLERYYTHFRQTKTQANHAKGLDYQGPILGHSRGRSR